jgi:3-mercaptopyruvate sulfurtransferase SseA
LDGGLPCWLKCGYPVEKGPQPEVAEASYNATFDPSLLRSLEQVRQAQDDKSEQVYAYTV